MSLFELFQGLKPLFGRSDPDPHLGEKSDPDPHQKDADCGSAIQTFSFNEDSLSESFW
jgi:hypothetical protein